MSDEVKWQTVVQGMPGPHTVYRVWRADVGEFHATTCHGMHAPWWVPRNGYTGEESEPILMQQNDLWLKPPLVPEGIKAFGEETKS